jgi:hypothetical protein
MDLRHRRVHQRIARAAFAPGGKSLLRQRPFFPLDPVVFRPETLAAPHLREVGQHLEVELAPHQFLEPGRRAAVVMPAGLAREVPHGHCSETQVHAEIAGPLHRGQVTLDVVAADAVDKGSQQFGRAGAARRKMQLAQIGGLESQLGEARHFLSQCRRPRCQPVRQQVHRMRLQVGLVQSSQPRAAVRGEDGIGRARLREHLPAFEDHMVLEGMQRDAVCRQGRAHLLVALDGGRVFIVVGEHRLHAQPSCQCRDFLAGRCRAP